LAATNDKTAIRIRGFVMPRIVPSQVLELIHTFFPNAKTQTTDFAVSISQSPQISAILDLLAELPSELIVMKPAKHIEYLSSIAALRDVVERWRVRGNFDYSYIPGLRQVNPLTMIAQALADCPDEVPAPETTGLTFVKDDTLRNALRLDISAVNSALINREWKAATVLAGSVVEALLLWAIKKARPKKIQAAIKSLLARNALSNQPAQEPDNWTLPQLRLVAAELKLIKDRTVKQIQLAQNFRNLIHPGRTQRLGEVCNRGTAMAAIAAVEFVVEDLSP
jgi:hypothetical protein